MYSKNREKAISGTFTFVALDDNKQPIKRLGKNDAQA